MMRRHALLALAWFAVIAVGCGPTDEVLENRQWTDDMEFRITSDPLPPRARERVLYKVVVRDRKSGEPIERGEGRVFATSRDGANTWDALLPGPELGTYYGTVNFVTAGEWAIAIQFRRDSTRSLERMDWMQEVLNATTSTTP